MRSGVPPVAAVGVAPRLPWRERFTFELCVTSRVAGVWSVSAVMWIVERVVCLCVYML